MEWIKFKDKLPKDKQKITVLDGGKELQRTFYRTFWNLYGRSLWCSVVCKEWKPRTIH